jgi:hypothetical protein
MKLVHVLYALLGGARGPAYSPQYLAVDFVLPTTIPIPIAANL